MNDLTDTEWCLLDLLLRAKRKGVSRLNRHELLNTKAIPDGAKLQLVWAALGMSNGEYVKLHGQHDFEITPAGEALFLQKFAKPSAVADHIIALPDMSCSALS